MNDKPIPFDLEAEQATLGSLILDRDGIIQVADFLHPDDFFKDQHAAIYGAIVDLYKRREPPDAVTLASELARSGKLDMVGGHPYLIRLVNRTPTAVHIEYYARIVERCSVLRRLISAGGEIAALGYDTELDPDEALQKAQQKIQSIATRQASETGKEMEDSMSEFMDFLELVSENRTGVTGLSSGLRELDGKTGGFQAGELIIIAGRPGTGKTTAAQNMGLAAAKLGKQVAMYELEMTRKDLSMRLVAREAQINYQEIRTGRLSDADNAKAWTAATEISALPFYIDDAVPLNVMQLGVKAHKRKATVGLDLLIVDYLQLLKSSTRNISREQQVAEVSQELKLLAKSLSVPVIACAQLNRQAENRPGGRAQLSDLRESGQIENDADIVMFIHREENGPTTVAEFDIVKHRSGPQGGVSVYYDAATMTFANFYRD